MTSITTHRGVDFGMFVAVAAASLATGINVFEKDALIEACTLINDLIDFRSDTSCR